MHTYIYIYVRAERERERDRASERDTHQQHGDPPQNLGSPDRTPASACMCNAPNESRGLEVHVHMSESHVRCVVSSFLSREGGRASEAHTNVCTHVYIYIYIYIYVYAEREQASEAQR